MTTTAAAIGGAGNRKKSAAQQLEESKLLYVKSSSVRQKRHDWSNLSSNPSRQKTAPKTVGMTKFSSTEHTNLPLSSAPPSFSKTKQVLGKPNQPILNNFKAQPPPVPPRKKKLEMPSPAAEPGSRLIQQTFLGAKPAPICIDKPAPVYKASSPAVRFTHKTSTRPNAQMLNASNIYDENSTDTVSAKLVKILAPTTTLKSVESQRANSRTAAENDMKNRLISLLSPPSSTGTAVTSVIENSSEPKSILKRSQSLNRSSPNLLKEGWALKTETTTLALPPASAHKKTSESNFSSVRIPKLTAYSRQKSLPSLKQILGGAETQENKPFEEDCSTVRADIGSDDDSVSSSASEKVATEFRPSITSSPNPKNAFPLQRAGEIPQENVGNYDERPELRSFFDTMGLESDVLRKLSCTDDTDSLIFCGSIASIPSTLNWSNTNSESAQSWEKDKGVSGNNYRSRKPVSIIEKQARIIKWIYGCDK